MSIDKETIINFGFEGWPIRKMNLKEVLVGLGATYNPENDTYEIPANSPILDSYPITLEDDGMGYGVNEQFITGVNKIGDKAAFFIDKALHNIDIWMDNDYIPGSVVKRTDIKEDKNYYIADIRKTDNGSIEYKCVYYAKDTSAEDAHYHSIVKEEYWFDINILASI